MGSIELLNIDCMEYMKTCKDKQFDLAVVDPPYLLGSKSKFVCKTKSLCNDGKNSMTLDRGLIDGGNGKSLGLRPNKDYFNELYRVSKNQIISGMQYFVKFLIPHDCVLIWDKMNGTSRYSDVEIFYTSFNTATRLVNKWIEPNNRIHPTQKPVGLYEWILKNYATENQTILDTHLGSGSIAIAVHKANEIDKMNLSFVGCEIDKEYFEASLKRFNNETRQQIMQF